MRNPFKSKAAAVPGRPDTQTKTLTPDGYPVTQFPAGFGAILRVFGGAGSYSQMYSRQANVRTVVDAVAREGAELKLKMYEKVPRSPSLPSERLEIPDHGMARLLCEPTPGQSSFRFWYATFADIEIYDFAIWQVIDPRGVPEALVRVPPTRLTPMRDPVTGLITEWRNLQGQVIDSSKLIVFWGYDPESIDSSVSPMETLRRTLAEEWAAGQNREGMWHNSLRKDGIIEQELESKKMSDEARESFLLDVEDALTGPQGNGRPLMLEPGQHWKDSVWSPREMEYISARRLTRLEVAASFHIPPAFVAASLSGQEPTPETLRLFYQSSLPPRLARIEREIEAQLLPRFDQSYELRENRYVEFNLDAKLRGSFEEQAAIMATTAGGPIVTVNEARARINLPPIPGGDQIFIPLNSIRGGGPQGAPQNPVDTPAELNPAGTTPGGGSQQEDGPAAEEVAKMLADADRKFADAQAKAEHEAFMREQRARYEERHANVILKFFTRQRSAVGKGTTINRSRWDKELADDLFGVAYQAAEAVGQDAAKRIQGSWDSPRTANYIRANVESAAGAINAETEARLQNESDPEIVFGPSRASQLAKGRTAFAVNWALMEAAHQNGAV